MAGFEGTTVHAVCGSDTALRPPSPATVLAGLGVTV